MNPMSVSPDWLHIILDAVRLTDGIDRSDWHYDPPQSEYIVEIQYGEETLSFCADSDGQDHGCWGDKGIMDLTTPSQVQQWCAMELYQRLQQAKREINRLKTHPDDATDSTSSVITGRSIRYGLGTQDGKGGIRMWAGPFPEERQALDMRGTSPRDVIVRLNADDHDEIIRKWDNALGWVLAD